MSVVTKPRRLTARERSTLTPAQELEQLVAEQAYDDDRGTWADTPSWAFSLDGPSSQEGGGTVGGDMVGRDPWGLVDASIDLGFDPGEVAYSGDVVDASPPSHGLLRGQGLIDVSAIPHGTAGGYTNHKCKCVPCTVAWATYKRARRAAKAAA